MDTGLPTASAYRTLADDLRRSLTSVGLRPGQRFASEHDLARQQKVSRVTVRRATSLLIDEGLLERRAGKGLFVRARSTGLRQLQVIAGDLAWEPCLRVARGAHAAARAAGVDVLLRDAHGNAASDLALMRRLPESDADGAIIVAVRTPGFAAVLCELALRRFPFVLVDQRLRDLPVPSVAADNRDGGRQVGAALTALGHRRIAFIGDLEADTVRERLDGLRDAVGDADLPFDRALAIDLQPGDPFADWSPLVDRAVRDLMRRARPPTAIFASCDAIARAAYATLAGLGLSVPRDVSVVGFDDDPLALRLDPPLASVTQPFEAMGATAFAQLQARIADPASAIDHRAVPVSFVPRGSCAPPPRGIPSSDPSGTP